MTPETAQKISKALNQMLADLHGWLKQLGLSEAEVIPLYRSAIRENGLLAKMLADCAATAIPLSTNVPVKLENFEQELARIQSEEWLLSQPEPEPQKLAELLVSIKNALPNLRQQLSQSAKAGPRHRHGGRHKELPDPALRRQIRDTIKKLRGPGINLHDLFKRLARKHEVSPTTIKRIWAEGKLEVKQK